jgi:biotin transport system substrate-specific component
MKNKVFNTKDLLYIVMFTSIMAATSGFSLSIGQTSITFQTFFVFLSGITLGSKRAALSMVLYILLGIIGLPVFSAFQSGYSVLLGPSGGFLLSFPIAAFITGIYNSENNNSMIILKFLLASLAIYLLGGGWLMFVLDLNILEVFIILITFLPGDVIKIYLVLMTYKKLSNHLN